MKNSNVRHSIFQEVQQNHGLLPLKLIKAAVTRWLSHGKASERVLVRFEPLVCSLEACYLRKREPAILGVRDQLIDPQMVAIICLLADVIKSTNLLQLRLQASHLNFLDIPPMVAKLIDSLEEKKANLDSPGDSFYSRLSQFLGVLDTIAKTSKVTRAKIVFDKKEFEEKIAKPFIQDLIAEVRWAFDIPPSLQGMSTLDPQRFPADADDSYGQAEIESLKSFYGSPCQVEEKIFAPVVDPTAVTNEFSAFKAFVGRKKSDYEEDKSLALLKLKAEKETLEKKKESPFNSGNKKRQLEKKLKDCEEEISKESTSQKYTFEIMFRQWMRSKHSSRHPEMTKLLNLAALIPPSTAEVERIFSLVNLIVTPLRKKLDVATVAQCVRICKYGKFSEGDFKEILDRWLGAEDTKSKSRKARV